MRKLLCVLLWVGLLGGGALWAFDDDDRLFFGGNGFYLTFDDAIEGFSGASFADDLEDSGLRSGEVNRVRDACVERHTPVVDEVDVPESSEDSTEADALLVETELHEAVRDKDLDAVKKLLFKKGADPNAKNRFKLTPLHLAAATHEDPAIATVLLANGADVNALDFRGYTPLDRAFLHIRSSKDIISLLLTWGGHLNDFSKRRLELFMEVHCYTAGQGLFRLWLTGLNTYPACYDAKMAKFLKYALFIMIEDTSSDCLKTLECIHILLAHNLWRKHALRMLADVETNTQDPLAFVVAWLDGSILSHAFGDWDSVFKLRSMLDRIQKSQGLMNKIRGWKGTYSLEQAFEEARQFVYNAGIVTKEFTLADLARVVVILKLLEVHIHRCMVKEEKQDAVLNGDLSDATDELYSDDDDGMELVDAEGEADLVQLMRGVDLGYGPNWRAHLNGGALCGQGGAY